MESAPTLVVGIGLPTTAGLEDWSGRRVADAEVYHGWRDLKPETALQARTSLHVSGYPILLPWSVRRVPHHLQGVGGGPHSVLPGLGAMGQIPLSLQRHQCQGCILCSTLIVPLIQSNFSGPSHVSLPVQRSWYSGTLSTPNPGIFPGIWSTHVPGLAA